MPEPRTRVRTLLTVVRQTAKVMVDELVARLHAAGYTDITAAHQSVFENIDPDGTRLTTLAECSGMTHQSMGELVQALERAGYLERRGDPSDRRARVIVLTKKGRDLVRRAIAETADIDTTWHQHFKAAGYDVELQPLLETALQAQTHPVTTNARAQLVHPRAPHTRPA